jgi:hypothetical protein
MSRTRTLDSLRRIALWVAVVAVIGCHRAAKAPTDEQSLRQRVTGFWTAKKDRQVVEMYGYLEHGFRDRTSLADYVQSVNRDIKFFDFKIEGVEREAPDRAVVKVTYAWQLPEYVMSGMKPPRKVESGVPEVWKFEGDDWYRLVQESSTAAGRASRPQKSSK